MPTLHLVSHTHWDREWYLTYQHFRLKLVHLVDNLLDILENDRSYRHFMLDGQTVVLEDYLEIRPEREGELRAQIRTGRIGIGPWFILPDEFLVSPEALIRNLLEGDRICRSYGRKMPIGYIPDTFGHIGQLPQILRGFNMQTAGVWRGIEDVPNQFVWQSPDGSSVLTAYLRGGYGNAAGVLAGGVERFTQEVARLRDELAPHSPSPHLLLMHGVDHQEPDLNTARAVAVANVRLEDDRVLHSTLMEYFTALQETIPQDTLPVITGELRSSRSSPLLPGVLSTRMWIKQRNNACQNLLERWAEPFSAWAEALRLQGHAVPDAYVRAPAGVLRQAWRLLLLCHPHDSICGCSIDAVHEEMRPRFDQVEQMGEVVTAQSLSALAEQVQTAALPGQPEGALVVFNPGARQRTDLVSAAIEALPGGKDILLLDANGTAVPFEISGTGSSTSFNMTMGRKEFLDMIGFMSGGVIMGQVLQDTQVWREGNVVHITVTMGQQGQPNIEAWDAGRKAIDAHLQDQAVQTIQVRASSAGAQIIRFTAQDIPSFGYRSYSICATEPVPQPAPQLNALTKTLLPLLLKAAEQPAMQKLLARFTQPASARPPYEIENAFFQVRAAADGTLDVLDRRSGVLYSGLNRFVDGGERGDEYNTSPPEQDVLITARLKGVQVERGAVVQALTLDYVLDLPVGLAEDRKSRSAQRVAVALTSTITLAAGVPRVEISTTVDNRAQDHRLRVHFPLPFAADRALHDGHFHVTTRPVGLPTFDETWIEQPRPEVPQRAFTAVFGNQQAFVLANRGLPEVEVLRRADGNAEIALTLLRCVGWLSRDDFPERKGHAGPGEPTPGAQLPGIHRFDYAILAGAAQDSSTLYQLADDFAAPLRGVVTGLHEGVLPAQASFLQVEPAEFAVTAVKQVENQPQAWLVRGYNRSSAPIAVTLTSMLPVQRAFHTNMLEERGDEIVLVDGGVPLQVKPWQVISVLLE